MPGLKWLLHRGIELLAVAAFSEKVRRHRNHGSFVNRLVGLRRSAGAVRRRPRCDKLDVTGNAGPIQPVPVRLEEVGLRYPHTDYDALRPVSLHIR